MGMLSRNETSVKADTWTYLQEAEPLALQCSSIVELEKLSTAQRIGVSAGAGAGAGACIGHFRLVGELVPTSDVRHPTSDSELQLDH